MSKQVSIVGAGTLGRALAAHLAYHGIAVRLYSRRERAQVLADHPLPDGVSAEPLSGLKSGCDPVVLVLSCEERSLVAAARAAGAAEVPRTVVAAANVALLGEVLPFWALAGRPVLVVTNPVELIVELLAARAPTAHVIGFGMGTDRRRVVEGLARGFSVADPGRALPIGGFHALRPIPVLSALPDLAYAIGRTPMSVVVERLAADKGVFESGTGAASKVLEKLMGDLPAQATAHDKLHATVRALTAAEFRGDRPPLLRPLEELGALARRLLTGAARAPEDVSARAPLAAGAACVGGAYDPASGAFWPAALGPSEAVLFEAALSEHRAAVARLVPRA